MVTPATIGVALIVTVKTPLTKATLEGAAVLTGAVKAQAKSDAKAKPTKGTTMIAEPVMVLAEVKVVVTVTSVCLSEPLDKVTAALDRVSGGIIATREAEVVPSNLMPEALAVSIVTSVLAA